MHWWHYLIIRLAIQCDRAFLLGGRLDLLLSRELYLILVVDVLSFLLAS